jgi:hypothetical protein
VIKLMKAKIPIIVLLITWGATGGVATAGLVSMKEAANVGTNWIALTIQQEGTWGGYAEADIDEIEEIVIDGRLAGYCCHVRPAGYIVVQAVRGLAPIRAYSATSDLLLSVETGAADFVRARLGCILDAVEEQIGPAESVDSEDLRGILQSDYSADWAELSRSPGVFAEDLRMGETEVFDNLTPGVALCTSVWGQKDPYNQHAPSDPDCLPDGCCPNEHCSNGCVQVAGAQIMYYWRWPPITPGGGYRYDWAHMADVVTPDSSWQTRDAVSLLIHEVGDQVGATYCDSETGEPCGTGGTNTIEMMDQYPDFFYSSSLTTEARYFYWDDPDGWWAIIVGEIDSEQPIQYALPGHSTVCDGYRISGSERQYHINFGWAGHRGDGSCYDPYPNSNTWYTMDEIPCSDYEDEYVVLNIHPVNRLYNPLTGNYDPPMVFPYRYLAASSYSGSGANFYGGQYLQFKKNDVTITCPESATGSIRFFGNPGVSEGAIRIYTKGDYQRGFRIDDGALAIYAGGGLFLR